MGGLLVHACCGPCLIHPHRSLGGERSLAIFFFNPNIHPSREYARRLEAVEAYCAMNDLPLTTGDYCMEDYFRAVAGDESNRCRHCYRMRLSRTARAAADGGHEAFTTTLTVSPYQDHESIKAIGEAAGSEFGIRFEYQDFRAGFRTAQRAAAELGLYRQPYCGCVYSERERYGKKTEAPVGDALRER